MIPQTQDNTVESTMTGKKIAMRLDEESLVHLMDILTQLYSNPQRAIIREYATNAADSHIEAGQTRPIQITTPTPLAPTFRVKDEGVGLNEQDIEEVYSLYGKSTKRETNEQTGSLGLGGKSALAYGASFSIIGIKNGIRTMVTISRDEDGTGVMTVVEESPTDEPNGVEVVIPIRTAHYNFEADVNEFFKFWPEGSVLVNGKEPDRVEGLKLNDHLMLVEKQHYSDDHYIIMGNVAYPVPISTPFFSHDSSYALVAQVGMGDVNFTPSREDLKLTRRTKECLERLSNEAKSAVSEAVKRDVAAASNHADALRCTVHWRKALGSTGTPKATLTYNNEEIPNTFSIELPTSFKVIDDRGNVSYAENHEEAKLLTRIIVAENKQDKLTSHDRPSRIDASTAANALFVYGYKAATFTAGHKRKLLGYLEEKGLEDIRFFVLTQNRFPSKWTDKSRYADWEDVRKVVIQSRAGLTGTRKHLLGSYPAWDVATDSPYSAETQAEDIDASDGLYYFSDEEFEMWRRSYEDVHTMLVATAHRILEKGTLVRLGLNRVAKFQRDFPTAIPLKDAVEKKLKDLMTTLGDEVLIAWKTQRDVSHQIMGHLDPTRIKDPELQRACELAQMDVQTLVGPLGYMQSNRLRSCFDIEGLDLGQFEVYTLGRAYPLLLMSSRPHEHCYIYVNAVYDAVRKENDSNAV